MSASAPGPRPAAGDEPVGRQPTVLVVDDEDLICESLRTYLLSELDGVEVLTAAGAAEALLLLAEAPIDVILTDHKMPGMTGLELLAEVREHHPAMARVLMTAYPDAKLAQTALSEGRVDRFFTKPLDPDEVVTTVAELLDDVGHTPPPRRSMVR